MSRVTAPVPVSAVPRADEDATAVKTAIASVIPGTTLTYGDTARLARTLYDSGLLSRSIKSPEQAFAVIVAGAEIGLPPMLALRSVALVEGKPVIAADVQLGAFKRAGGRARFDELSAERAVLWLRHPNGDEHTETYTIDDAKAAGLAGKDNYRRFPRAMLRSRAITAGLKSVGWEPAAGVYDPDEAQHFTPVSPPTPLTPPPATEPDVTPDARSVPATHPFLVPVARAETGRASLDGSGGGEMTLEEARAMTVSDRADAFKGHGADVLDSYTTEHLQQLLDWFESKLKEGHRDDFARRAEAIALILEAREAEQGQLFLGEESPARSGRTPAQAEGH